MHSYRLRIKWVYKKSFVKNLDEAGAALPRQYLASSWRKWGTHDKPNNKGCLSRISNQAPRKYKARPLSLDQPVSLRAKFLIIMIYWRDCEVTIPEGATLLQELTSRIRILRSSSEWNFLSVSDWSYGNGHNKEGFYIDNWLSDLTEVFATST
jgi:hypothetical protein